MSGRFVRASKYRHVHGESTRKDKSILGITFTTAATESFGVACSTKFVAWPTRGGGGPIQYRPLDFVGRGPKQNANFMKSSVVDLEFSPFMPSMLAMGSSGGSISIAILKDNIEEKQSETVSKCEGHGKKIGMVRFNPAANNILGSASHDNTVKVWDIKAQACVATRSSSYKILGMAWSPNGDRLAGFGGDKNLHVWDPRDEGKGISITSVTGSKPARPFWIDENTVGVVGHTSNATRMIQVYDVRSENKTLHETNIDQSSGVLTPYFDEDTKVLFVGGKGDGNIRYYEWSQGSMFHLSEFRDTTSTKGLCWLPKRAVKVESCEIARAYRLLRDSCEAVSFKVPRKSEIFQEDIFPNAYAGVPAVESEAWVEGKNGTPARISMNPADRDDSAQQEQEFVADKSPAELKAELAQAHAKIAELEAEIAKLKAS